MIRLKVMEVFSEKTAMIKTPFFDFSLILWLQNIIRLISLTSSFLFSYYKFYNSAFYLGPLRISTKSITSAPSDLESIALSDRETHIIMGKAEGSRRGEITRQYGEREKRKEN